MTVHQRPPRGSVASLARTIHAFLLGTAKPLPGTSDKGCIPLRACSLGEMLFYPAKEWCLEKCSHLRLFRFREALELSQLSRRNGAGERSRTVQCFVGNDAAHHARPREW
jgi:hypothetical protein